eukprot:COSAG01_NODE_5771_length_4043_cov_30.383114_2_plen_307_part_00
MDGFVEDDAEDFEDPAELLRKRREARLREEQAMATEISNPVAGAGAGARGAPPPAQPSVQPAAGQTDVEVKARGLSNFGKLAAAMIAILVVIAVVVGVTAGPNASAADESSGQAAGDCSKKSAPKDVPRPPLRCQNNEIGVYLVVSTSKHADEISVQIDGMPAIGHRPRFKENMQYVDGLCLNQGLHTVKYFDSYGDGWGCGYWEVEDDSGSTIVGGPVTGRLHDGGGETKFKLPGGSAVKNYPVVVTIVTKSHANQITWDIDAGQVYPGAVAYKNNKKYDYPLSLPEGQHKINYFDAYGDGWHGG